MQTQTQSDPAATPAPAQAPPAPVTITTVGPGGITQTLTVPATEADVEKLLAQRAELSEQLSSLSARRDQLSSSIRAAPEGASRTGLEDRIRVLDQRIIQLETDLAATGRQLSSAPAELAASTQSENPGGGGDFEEGLMIGGFSVFLVAAVAYFFAKRRWKRRAVAQAKAPPESSRLERVEQGIEAIAIEIERVSEGQRFVTRLLSESQTPLGASHRIPQPAAAENEGKHRS
ncbi:MAG: hypothetical protein ABIR58_07410 [Gemmatimonadaceae bacterium]